MKYKIEDIIKIFEKSTITKLELEIDEMKIKLEKDNVVVNNETVINPKIEEKEVDKITGFNVVAPVVGTYYSQKDKNSKPFVKKGDIVNKGDVLCIIEAMKIMNEITAPVSGKIVDICSSNESLVEYNQILFVIEE